MIKIKSKYIWFAFSIVSFYISVQAMDQIFGTPQREDFYQEFLKGPKKELFSSSFFKSNFSKGLTKEQCQHFNNYLKNMEKNFQKVLDIEKPISLEKFYNLLENKICKYINELAEAAHKNLTNFRNTYNSITATIDKTIPYEEKRQKLLLDSLLTNNLSDREKLELYSKRVRALNILAQESFIEVERNILGKIYRDFAPFIKKYTKEEVIGALKASAQDLFLEIETVLNPQATPAQMTIKTATKLSNISTLYIPSPEMQKKLEKEWKEKTKADDLRILGAEDRIIIRKYLALKRWGKSLSDLNEFLINSQSTELPPYFEKISSLNKEILKLISSLKIIKEEKLNPKNKLNRDLPLIKQTLKEIKEGIANVRVFFKGPRDAKEILQILVGTPKKQDGLFDKIIKKIEEDFGSNSNLDLKFQIVGGQNIGKSEYIN